MESNKLASSLRNATSQPSKLLEVTCSQAAYGKQRASKQLKTCNGHSKQLMGCNKTSRQLMGRSKLASR